MKIKNFILVVLVGLGLILSGQIKAKQKMLQVKGSDTMVNLVNVLVEEFMARNPKAQMAILGGGSGTGIAALINGTCDIANHSRPIKEKELMMAQERGLRIHTFIIAIDGLSVIVNAHNPVEKLTLGQIGAIFRGEITNWKEVGGPDLPITLYGRQSNSGTYVFFQEHVLGNKNYSPKMNRMNGNAQIVEAVSRDKSGIGYVGVGYVVNEKGEVFSGLKVLKVSHSLDETAYSPLSKKDVEDGLYPIVRPLFQSTIGKPTGLIRKFIEFEIGPEGQKIVSREGFFPIGKKQQELNAKNLEN